MSNIENNEEEKKETEELSTQNEAPKSQLVENTKQKTKQGAKKVLKNKKVQAFLIAHLPIIIIIVLIIIAILMLIGIIVFLVTMPGLLMEKIEEFIKVPIGNICGMFSGDSTTAKIPSIMVVISYICIIFEFNSAFTICKAIKFASDSSMFISNYKLSDIQFNSANKIMQSAFAYCSSLSRVNFPNVSSMETYVFLGCENLEYVSMPKLTVINQGTFYNAKKLSSVYFSTASIIYYNAFNGTGLTAVSAANFPALKALSDFTTGQNHYQYGFGHFANCKSLSYVDLPLVTTIGTMRYANNQNDGIFEGCDNLEYVYIV